MATASPRSTPLVSLDFDGVIHDHYPWRGVSVADGEPIGGAFDFLRRLSRHARVAIHSARSHDPSGLAAMQRWLTDRARGTPDWQSWLPLIEWWPTKPPAQVALDDRAVTFRGEWPAVDDLVAFRPWNVRR